MRAIRDVNAGTSIILRSALDASVNHVAAADDGGFWESRFVQRRPDYFICYLSSHSGCAMACRFCHLTASGQTTMGPASLAHYQNQADRVFATYRSHLAAGGEPVSRVHFNLMARGEPLANPTITGESHKLYEWLDGLARRHGVPETRVKVSTIIPAAFTGRLDDTLRHPGARLYYSLYSLDSRFRRRWLPKAMEPERALDLVADYQARTGTSVSLHWAFISGENDRDEDIEAIEKAVCSRGIRAKFNLVRYNPRDARHGTEPSEARLDTLFGMMSRFMQPEGNRIVPRVGPDVAASCGMFVTADDLAAAA